MPKVRVLLIEDDPDVAELLVFYFDSRGYEVTHAMDGKEGIAAARSRFPNVILLDVMLPDMSGWEIAQVLRSGALTRYIPIIFLTQRNSRSDKLRGLSMGVDDYVTKPFDMEELRLRVQGAIRRATQERLYEPRTGLPGGALIEAEINQRQDERGWHRLEITIEGLKPFRDVYGFLAADEALAYAAGTLLDTVRQYGTPDDFVGITETDGFVVLTHAPQIGAFQKTLCEAFNQGVRAFYAFADVDRGYLLVDGGDGTQQPAPLMQLNVREVN